MSRRQAHVFVHVEDIDLRPVHVHAPQRFQKRELRIAGGEDDVGDAVVGDGLLDDARSFLGGGSTHFRIGLINRDG